MGTLSLILKVLFITQCIENRVFKHDKNDPQASLMAIFETSPAPVTDLFKFLVIENKESLK